MALSLPALAQGAAVIAAPIQPAPSVASPPPEAAQPVCRDPGAAEGPATPSLPNLAEAIRKTNKAVILAVGGFGGVKAAKHGQGYFNLTKRYLERAYKGVEVQIVYRGAPGALARDAAETIRVEAALVGANLVLWQVGMGDALARIDPPEFRESLGSTIDWLRENRIDVMLVGLLYTPAVASDSAYQAIRSTLRDVSVAKNAPRIRRYEAEETIARMRVAASGDQPVLSLEDRCFADWLAQAVAVGLYGRRPSQQQH